MEMPTTLPKPFSRSENEKGGFDSSSSDAVHTHINPQDCAVKESTGDNLEGVAEVFPLWKWTLILAAIYSSCFLYGLDNTIVADIQSATVKQLGQIEKLSWLGVGFPLGSVATILPFGKAFGVFEVKRLYIIALLVFAVASAVCGAAPTMNALIFGRTLAGAGGAGGAGICLNLLALNTTIRRRPIYMGITGLTWGLGAILGPIIGGAFSDGRATWRWPMPGHSTLKKLLMLDSMGIALNASLYVTWVMALTFGGSTWAWSDRRTIGLLVAFGIQLILFVISQTYSLFTTVERRLFPVDFLGRYDMVLLYVCTACAGSCVFISIYYIPLYFQFARADSATTAAVKLLPFILVNVFFVMSNGVGMPKWGYYMPWYVVCGTFTLTGGALMYTVDSKANISSIYGYTTLIAIGCGCAQQAAYSIAPAKVEPHRVPDAIGFINVAQNGAVVVALTISGTVFQDLAIRNLKAIFGNILSEAEIQAAIAGTQSSVLENLSPELRAQAVEAIVSAIDNVYILVITAGALCLICSIFLKREILFMEVVAGA
ncbi:MFS general substrate transporter [Stipitochalara longipes BDJ]|nr:MFS general substrate transporter [Stipitochalara longipes BDJ]